MDAMSVSQLAEIAQSVPFNPNVRLRYWIATVESVLKQAEIYEREGNIQRAYLQYFRYADFVIKRLPQHPEAKDKTSSVYRKLLSLRDGIPFILDRMEKLKPRIEAAYQAEQRRLLAEKERETGDYSSRPGSRSSYQLYGPRPLSQTLSRDTPPLIPTSTYSSIAPNRNGSYRYVDGTRNQDLARQIVESERERRHSIRRRRADSGSSGRSSDLSGISYVRPERVLRPETPDEAAVANRHLEFRRRYDSSYRSDDAYGARSPSSQYSSDMDNDSLARSIQRLGLQVRRSQQSDSERSDSPTTYKEREADRIQNQGNWQYSYPSVPKRASSTLAASPPPLPDIGHLETRTRDGPTPALPPKIRNDQDQYEKYAYKSPPPPPTVPLYTGDSTMLPPPLPKKVLSPVSPDYSRASTPGLSPSTKSTPTVPPLPPVPKELTQQPTPPNSEEDPFAFQPSAFLEDGRPLRTIFLPEDLRHAFLKIAEPNTRNNLETCGILCGMLVKNALFITKLIIPEQEATSDTCTTKDEESLFSEVFDNDLLIIGWIHTHPTQTCFMSSVDLHTHCSYQLMLDESIAIVCAPTASPSWGVFRLTDPPGIGVITNCKEKSQFHPHPSGVEIYTEALRPGHVVLINTSFDVKDLRKNVKRR